MMQKIVESSCDHQLKIHKILQSIKFSCISCSEGKLIIQPSPTKIGSGSITFLERIHGDICGQYTHHMDHLDILWF
jgi:hypothetical protein